MKGVAMIGVFICLSGLVLYRHADDQKQQDIASTFVGVGLALLVIAGIWFAATQMPPSGVP